MAIKASRIPADNPTMGEWFWRLLGRGEAGHASSRPAVLDALQAALRNRCKVFLEAPDQGIVAATNVEQITADGIIIAQPAIGGMTYPLAFGESLKLSFVDQRTNLTGQTRCLGRVKIASGNGGATLFAYRLALPSRLRVEERRTEPRSEIDFAAAPEAQLYSGSLLKPLAGRLTSISVIGARMHIAAPLSNLSMGQQLYLKFTLPEPVGLIDEVVQVERMDLDRRNGTHTIGVTFKRRVDRLAGVMRSLVGGQAASTPMQQQPGEQRRRSA